MGLIEDIGAGPVAIDTAPFIYLIEENTRYLPLLSPLFEAVDNGSIVGVTSEITLLEVLVVPYRCGDTALADRYETILTRAKGLTMRPLTRKLLKSAALLRARTGMKTPDAIQMSTALAAECTALVTNDRDFRSVPGLKILQLENYL